MAKLSTEDQAAIRQLWKKYVAAFNKKSARGCARLYAPDGDLIGVDGVLLTGPAAIEKYYKEEIFAKFPTATVSDSKLTPARTIAGSVALVNGTWQVLGVGPKPADVVGTFVVRRSRGTWSYVAVRFMTPLVAP
jgi:uncharacterized protein (TIGR02246 family)